MAGVKSEGSEGDKILRDAVRQNLDKWLQKLDCSGDVEKKLAFKMKFVEKLRKSPVAVETARANEQHYEVPTNFFRTVSFFLFLSFSLSLGVLRGCDLCIRKEEEKVSENGFTVSKLVRLGLLCWPVRFLCVTTLVSVAGAKRKLASRSQPI